ncbi:hypothetical protein Pmar_PMAR012414 [Perkinsus marinus ATCC 50983]|uniref:F-box domain-containing protein n=1 Tax=Perkinsus marinus (strain ATCC 50983 / TXsc) TaxID=423536 RepID=C5K799_PERM5|nr:hypothetical protein Pmar_PMAR012414 [Perkinsus marinus ATCC 50983]EER19434.1 hypothetical protein Pmar_PMAR012414 [Perkinsus marinus ATCC 50983]|eukprot:XP_002787638.1 hypothetical protein Pmar_PMAR012414 [Perkinsus marinus ATCC 50983]
MALLLPPPPTATAATAAVLMPVCCELIGAAKSAIEMDRMADWSLLDLPEGVLINVLGVLSANDLAKFEATCKEARRKCRSLNIWRELGSRVFGGQLQSGESFQGGQLGSTGKRINMDWKSRYKLFHACSRTFRDTDRSAMTFVDEKDYVAYLSARIKVEHLKRCGGSGIYLEFHVQKNADNLSLACVDFDAGGKSSVTFSPDTGAVIKESKIQENPRKIQGFYRQPMAQIQQLQPKSSSLVLSRFEGFMGMLLDNNGLTFYRRLAGLPWECTGVVTDLSWVQGDYVTPCIAFRDNGIYHVIIRRLGVYSPPKAPETCLLEPPRMRGDGWRPLDWEPSDDWEYLSDASDDGDEEEV